MLGGRERSRQVDSQDALPLVSRQEMDRPASGHIGRRHQAGHTASELHGGPHEMLNRSFVGDVGVSERPLAVAGPVADRRRRRLLQVRSHDEGTFAQEAHRRGPADARRRPRDDVAASLHSLHEYLPLVAPCCTDRYESLPCLVAESSVLPTNSAAEDNPTGFWDVNLLNECIRPGACRTAGESGYCGWGSPQGHSPDAVAHPRRL